jgi:chlorite dismutase
VITNTTKREHHMSIIQTVGTFFVNNKKPIAAGLGIVGVGTVVIKRKAISNFVGRVTGSTKRAEQMATLEKDRVDAFERAQKATNDLVREEEAHRISRANADQALATARAELAAAKAAQAELAAAKAELESVKAAAAAAVAAQEAFIAERGVAPRKKAKVEKAEKVAAKG